MEPERSATICYERVSSALTEHLPELGEAYQAELSWWGEEQPGPHVVYGNVLNPYIDRLLQSGDETSLRRVFAFVELLARSQDVRVQEIVATTVCEYLGNDQRKLAQAKRLMGPATSRISDDVERFWSG